MRRWPASASDARVRALLHEGPCTQALPRGLRGEVSGPCGPAQIALGSLSGWAWTLGEEAAQGQPRKAGLLRELSSSMAPGPAPSSPRCGALRTRETQLS